MDFFIHTFGQVSGTKIQFVYAPRSRGSFYSRKGYAVIGGRSEVTKFNTLAHEIAHFWWTGADSSTWEDWLNESFAEYAALLAFKRKFGNEKFKKRIKAYKKHADNEHAIWGVDRKDEQATLLLYRKGPFILEQLKNRMGDKLFFTYFVALLDNKIKTTQEALALLTEISSPKDAEWLKARLKTGY